MNVAGAARVMENKASVVQEGSDCFSILLVCAKCLSCY